MQEGVNTHCNQTARKTPCKALPGKELNGERSPRLHRRGPIEAHLLKILGGLRMDRLHGFIAVAQLKRNRPNHPFRNKSRLHGFIAVAQLKQPSIA